LASVILNKSATKQYKYFPLHPSDVSTLLCEMYNLWQSALC